MLTKQDSALTPATNLFQTSPVIGFAQHISRAVVNLIAKFYGSEDCL